LLGEHQHKVLTFGIIMALILRAIFIAIDAAQLRWEICGQA
jgi:tellurite resistance protein TerC